MHPDRLAYLAGRHAQRRAVIAKDVRTDEIILTLECGHHGHCVPHRDPRSLTDWDCRRCGEQHVLTSPLYAKEFAQ